MLTLLIKSEALSTFDCVWTNGIFSRRYDSTRQTTTGYRKQYLSWGSFISNVTMSLFFGWMRSTLVCNTQGPLSSRTSKWVSSSGSSVIIEYVYSTIDTCIYIYWKHGISFLLTVINVLYWACTIFGGLSIFCYLAWIWFGGWLKSTR